MRAPVDCEFVINCSAVIWVRRVLVRLETNFLCLWNISLDLSWREGKIIILSSNTAGCCLTITPARPSEARSPDASLMEVQPIRARSGPSNLVIFCYSFLLYSLMNINNLTTLLVEVSLQECSTPNSQVKIPTHSIMEGFARKTNKF